MGRLTIKQEKFCNYYVECGNASEAYRMAYSCEKAKCDTVNRKSVELLNNGKITARVKEIQAEQKAKSDITKEEVLKMLRNIMYADIRNFLTIKGGFVAIKDSSEWTDDMALQVESVRQTKDGIEIKLNGRAWSIQRICKMLGFDAEEKIAVNVEKNLSPEEAKAKVGELMEKYGR